MVLFSINKFAHVRCTISEAAEITISVSETPYEFHVNSPYPNPFNPSTTIEYVIPEKCNVKLVVYDILGREIVVLKDSFLDAGNYKSIWDGKDKNGEIIGSGVYIYKLTAGKNSAYGKIMFMR